MANGITQAALWAAVFTPTADEIAREIVQQEWEMRQEEEKVYWIGWDREFKRGFIQDLREHKAGVNLLTFNKQPLYPHITQDMQADMIESGELKIIDLKSINTVVAVWADENREEAKDPIYQEYFSKVKDLLTTEKHRIIS
ncbi:hypothetical protein CQA49_04960 [Helicobacter sp. MIT 00-7814]|uniref:hypothetical protein n=1 Tax=unclassified Helicobacter TaxID=2593540 RepID=UPI000E1EA92F|nr:MULTISPECIES: hypothetical protein [unclassified Helicobacter]RDU54350.1 hypothetical protein CQA37_05450 [Helicobacter sp. MIT 99-10781]RDU54427.1 hypothetical protein CQA49_04960 [Helicobacter sp. MIT 00-7814]